MAVSSLNKECKSFTENEQSTNLENSGKCLIFEILPYSYCILSCVCGRHDGTEMTIYELKIYTLL